MHVHIVVATTTAVCGCYHVGNYIESITVCVRHGALYYRISVTVCVVLR